MSAETTKAPPVIRPSGHTACAATMPPRISAAPATTEPQRVIGEETPSIVMVATKQTGTPQLRRSSISSAARLPRMSGGVMHCDPLRQRVLRGSPGISSRPASIRSN